MNEVTKLLEDARQRITDPEHWTQFAFARDSNGTTCAVSESDDPVCWCALGSISVSVNKLHATPRTYRLADRKMVAAAMRLYATTIARVNDDFGHAATLKMFDDAIKHSKMGEA